ncbi:MAG: hypothetical protein IKZ02_00660 [Alphaproteobacteria bacterium]|nr:hypothetical protein [Alphaproteobacteria bacterium]MBR4931516.1 hypothetical protein [Alphaproteobacteria bacterium]
MNSFLIGVYLLIFGNALVCGGILILLFLFLKRQKEGFLYITRQLNQLDKQIKQSKSKNQETPLSISMDEPIAKYKQVSLSDEVNINFIKD